MVLVTLLAPPCLPDQGDFGDSSSFGVGMECYLSGWGKVGHGENMPQDMYGMYFNFILFVRWSFTAICTFKIKKKWLRR